MYVFMHIVELVYKDVWIKGIARVSTHIYICCCACIKTYIYMYIYT